MSWLRKIFGGRATATADDTGAAATGGAPAIALPEPQLAALAADLAGFDAIAAGTTERALRYVLSGEDEAVLDLLASKPDFGASLDLRVCRHHDGLRHADILKTPVADPRFYVRLGKVYEAASRLRQRWLSLTAVGLPPWLEILLYEAWTGSMSAYGGRQEQLLSHAQLEAILTAANEPPDRVLRLSLFVRDETRHLKFLTIPGLPEAAARHPAVVREALTQSAAGSRAHAIERLAADGASPVPFVDILAAPESAHSARVAADAWLSTAAAELMPTFRALVADGTPAQRSRAIGLVWRFGGAGERAFLEARRAVETAADVLATLDGVLLQPVAASKPVAPVVVAAAAPAVNATTTTTTPAPFTSSTRPLPPLGADVRDVLRGLANAWHATITEKYPTMQPQPPTDAAIDEWLQLLQAPTLEIAQFKHMRWKPAIMGFGFTWHTSFKPILARPDFRLGHAVRLAGLLGMLRNDDRDPHLQWVNGLFDVVKVYQRAQGGAAFTLLDVATEAEAVGVAPISIGKDLIYAYERPRGWTAAELQPFFDAHPEVLEAALGQRPALSGTPPYYSGYARSHALELVAQAAYAPAALHPALWEIALGGSKTERPLAQQAIGGLDGAGARIVAALADPSQAVREAAAEWLADRRERTAIAALKTALKKEKKERGKAAMMEALERLGVSLDEFLDRPGLGKEAQKGLAKGTPEALAWFPFTRVETLHWADDGQAVDETIVRWWLVQANKLGTPEPGPLLRRYAAQLVSDEAAALGKLALEAFIAEDTALPTEAEAQAKAAAASWPIPVAHFLTQPKGSAIAHKGLLAIAAAMAGEAAAPLVSRYLKDWYGMRAAQCKALLQMLSWIDHPSAIQVLLATATRFRTPGIRKLAEECVHEVAQRRGWTIDELADRTVPSAGIDDSGRLVLDFGPRQFAARLDDALKLTLQNSEGKTIAGLPEPRADDDATLAAEAKQLFATAKKQVKTVVKQQEERLYEAMCVQRSWPFADWQTYVAGHPIVGRLAQRVVWMVLPKPQAETAEARSFRPLGDGTLTGPDDAAVTLAPDERIGVAHPLFLSEPHIAAWLKHLEDYEVEPLFDQLGRKPFRLSDTQRTEPTITDFHGHLVESLKLRGRATKRGYTRGPAEDGGWFFLYRRYFPGAGIAAEIHFSGNSLPEESRTVALAELTFERTSPDHAAGAAAVGSLAEVPAVLVSECWNDVREIAAEGPGFDAEWEKKIQP